MKISHYIYKESTATIKLHKVSEKILIQKVKFGRELWVFVCVHGPGSDMDEIEREAFWNYLDDCLHNFGLIMIIVVLLRDFNAHVGDEVVEEVVRDRMIGLCVERDGG